MEEKKPRHGRIIDKAESIFAELKFEPKRLAQALSEFSGRRLAA